eukprot:8127267-Lingulodinium_polyedra.AAC.1
MVLVEACRGTAHEGEIEKVDFDTATLWEAANWIASHWRMTDPLSDCYEEDDDREVDTHADLE